ncbi:phosphoadenosine phosphosulfate reductase family protein [Bacillus sp. UMB0728]|uniref:phosphoadenosine phosphosulfate reductase family protein n=1 Tax=Bacillus sp. UMB0728 TaxID=2066052 RepID=UPI000C792111|nr:phosphoadenosine phosphosulfate reductase family protein [Bacillus sp. UMB0728]PLR70563.1 hypothetical protein CYJ37_23830 [Bacillus sp. UMB0728]
MIKTYDETLMDWMFNEKEKLKVFDDLRDHIKDVYLADDKPLMAAVSFGKDSALMLTLLFQMLQGLNPSLRTKKVYIVSADTLVETKVMSDYIRKSLKAVEIAGKNLGIETILSVPDPKEKFFYNVIGKGLPAPKGNSRFRWCTGKLKLSPMDKIIEHVLSHSSVDFDMNGYDATLAIGTRLEESAARARSIKKHETSEYFSTHHSFQNLRVYTPIRYINTFDLWIYLENYVVTFPWGEKVSTLKEMYEDGKECPVVKSANDKACGGSSRNGCWTCLQGGRRDEMLEILAAKGNKDAPYLAKWKAFLWDVSIDVRYREPLRRTEYKAHLRRANEQYRPLSIFDEMDPYQQFYDDFKRATRGNEAGEYRPGGFTITMRKILLEKLLFTQEQVKYTLITEEEIQSILEAWEEDGFEYSRQDLLPIDHLYDGAIVFRPDWSLNREESTNPNPIFHVEYKFKYGFDEMVAYIKERQQFLKHQIFCYFDHEDMESEKLVWNKAIFVVCQEDIKSKEEANHLVMKWLFTEGIMTTGIDGRPFNKMVGKSKDAALNFLIIDALSEGIKNRNTNQVELEAEYTISSSGQLILAI